MIVKPTRSWVIPYRARGLTYQGTIEVEIHNTRATHQENKALLHPGINGTQSVDENLIWRASCDCVTFHCDQGSVPSCRCVYERFERG